MNRRNRPYENTASKWGNPPTSTIYHLWNTSDFDISRYKASTWAGFRIRHRVAKREE